MGVMEEWKDDKDLQDEFMREGGAYSWRADSRNQNPHRRRQGKRRAGMGTADCADDVIERH
jgi:hypothetical protein